MMDCKQFRDTLDCYVDGELSAEAMAAADAHRRQCAACGGAAADLNVLRLQLRRLVMADEPPPELEHRVRRALRMPLAAWMAGRRALWLAAAAALVLAIGGWAGLTSSTKVRSQVATVLDRAVLQLADTDSVVLEATVLCRDCVLAERYGAQTDCSRIGHHGALATSDGRLWNIVDQPSTDDLIYSEAMLGRKVRVRGRLFRDSSTIVIESYQVM